MDAMVAKVYKTFDSLRPLRPLRSIQILKNPCRTHATADTHRYDPILAVTALQFTDDAGGELGARAAQRMPERHSTTVRVDLIRVEFTGFDDRKRLRCKCFIQFDDIDLVESESSKFERFG